MSEVLLLFPFPSPAVSFPLSLLMRPLLPSLFPTLPFVVSPVPPVVCFDAKINFDDNAEFRQKAVFAMDDMTESDPTETEAAKWDLKYIGLDGNIACFGVYAARFCTHTHTHTPLNEFFHTRPPPGKRL